MLQEVGDIYESEGDLEAAVDAQQRAAEYLAVRAAGGRSTRPCAAFSSSVMFPLLLLLLLFVPLRS